MNDRKKNFMNSRKKSWMPGSKVSNQKNNVMIMIYYKRTIKNSAMNAKWIGLRSGSNLFTEIRITTSRPLNKSSEILIANRMENLNLYCKMLDFYGASKYSTVKSINGGHFLPFLTQTCKIRNTYSRFRSTKYKWLWIWSDPDPQQFLMLC